jgi:hypothetical protein
VGKIILGLIVLVTFFSKQLCAVGLITQFVLGKEYLKQETTFTQKDKNAFLLGVWFPGIWYVSKECKERCLESCSFDAIHQESDPFKKGVLFNQFLHTLEGQYFYESYFSQILDKTPFEIKECYLNILEDLIFCADPQVEEAKKLANETLFIDFDIENFSKQHSKADMINWYFTIFISISTPPLLIPEEISTNNRYKGLGVNLKLTQEILAQAKELLPTLASDEKILELLNDFILCTKHLIEEGE